MEVPGLGHKSIICQDQGYAIAAVNQHSSFGVRKRYENTQLRFDLKE